MTKNEFIELRDKIIEKKECYPKEFIDYTEQVDPETVESEEFTAEFDKWIFILGKYLLDMLTEMVHRSARIIKDTKEEQPQLASQITYDLFK